MVSIIDAEFGAKLVLEDGSATRLGELDRKLNLFFTAVFTVELVINAYANWFRRLVSNGCGPSARGRNRRCRKPRMLRHVSYQHVQASCVNLIAYMCP